MPKIRLKLETNFDRNAEHKNFLKRFETKNISTSKTKNGSKFFNFTVKELTEYKAIKGACEVLGYNLTKE